MGPNKSKEVRVNHEYEMMNRKANNDVIGAARDKCDSIPKQSDKGQQDTKGQKETKGQQETTGQQEKNGQQDTKSQQKIQGQQNKDSVHKCLNQSGFDFVAAIDLGTSATGCGYSTTTGFKSSPLDITCEIIWNEEGSVSQDMSKTKTCILLDKQGEFISFGYDAEYKYAQLRASNEHENCCFFHNFKMDLYKNKIPLSKLMLSDVTGKTEISAKTVFSQAILAVKTKLIENIKSTGKYNDFTEDRIRWILTVPAIWEDDAKLFMRECAQEIGIPGHQIIIALEPEAASVYCNYLKTERPNDISQGFQEPLPGTKYMVVDIGGGTTDITVHEKQIDGTLKELTKASGKGVGGVSVDEALMEAIQNALHKHLLSRSKTRHPSYNVLTILQTERPNVYLDMYYDVEKTKRTITTSTSSPVSFEINYTVLDTLFKAHFGKGLSEFAVPIEEDEILLDATIVNTIFDSTAYHILNVINRVMLSLKPDKISMIILVGGFANCEILQRKVEDNFSPIRVIVPVDAGLATLLGAVLFGHSPLVITSRVTRKAYGVIVDTPFNEEKHPVSRKFYHYGTCYCSGIISLIVAQNESILVGTRFTKEYTAKPMVSKAAIAIVTSKEDLPEFYNDKSCRKIGTLEIDIPNPSALSRPLQVEYIFGDTELIVVANEKDTNIKFETKIILD